MDFGAAMFFTDYAMAPGELGRALEAHGFESVWAPEHSHIPTSRKTPFPQGGDLPKKYYDAMDPFVALTAAAVATRTLRIGTGVCLVAQRDPIQTAKLVASIDQVSQGCFPVCRRGWLELGRDGRPRHPLWPTQRNSRRAGAGDASGIAAALRPFDESHGHRRPDDLRPP